MVDASHFDKPHPFLTEQSVVGAGIDLAIEVLDGRDAAHQAFIRRESGEGRWYLYGEHSFGGGSPQLSPLIVGHIDNLVGTESVGIGDGVEVFPLVVADDDACAFLDDGGEPVVQWLFQDDVVLDDIGLSSFRCIDIHHVEDAYFEDLRVDGLMDRDLILAFHLVDVTVVCDESYFPVAFEDLIHFTMEEIGLSYPFEIDFTVVLSLYLSEIVVSAHPDGIVGSPDYYRHT